MALFDNESKQFKHALKVSASEVFKLQSLATRMAATLVHNYVCGVASQDQFAELMVVLEKARAETTRRHDLLHGKK